MSKRMLMLIFILVILNILTGCYGGRCPSVIIDKSAFEAVSRIDIGNKYEYVSFDVTETDMGKDVIVHFERRTDATD